MTAALRVLFDGYWWESGPTANRTVQREIIHAWSRAFPADEIVLALRSSDAEEASVPDGARTVTTRLWPHGVANVLELGRLARHVDADWTVAHNYTPLSGRTAVFIHDVLFRDHPSWFSRAERMYFAGMLPTARRATLVTTSTAAEAGRIARHRRGGAPVESIGLAVPTELASAVPVRPAELEAVESYALTVGRLNVRKNLESVLAGAARSAAISVDAPLVVVGSAEHSGVQAELPDDIAALVRRGLVRFLGHVDDAELAWLYANASVSISLSRDEGFGLTPVEAAWFGAPVLVSDIDVHRETVGECASFVPLDATAAQIGEAIDATWGRLPDQHALSRLRERYSWEASVTRLREAMVRSG